MVFLDRQYNRKHFFCENDSKKHNQQSSTNEFSSSDSPLKKHFLLALYQMDVRDKAKGFMKRSMWLPR